MVFSRERIDKIMKKAYTLYMMQPSSQQNVITPQKFDEYADKLWQLVFQRMKADKKRLPREQRNPDKDHPSEYLIFFHLPDDVAKKTYSSLVAIFGVRRIQQYLWEFRKTHRAIMKAYKWQGMSKLASHATKMSYVAMRQLQEQHYLHDMKSIQWHTSEQIVSNFSQKPYNDHIIPDTYEEWATSIFSQFSTWHTVRWVEKWAQVVIVDGEVRSPYDYY